MATLSAGHARTLVTAAGSGRAGQADRRRGAFGSPGGSSGAAAGRQAQATPPTAGREKDADTLALEKLLSNITGLKVAINHKEKGGEVGLPIAAWSSSTIYAAG